MTVLAAIDPQRPFQSNDSAVTSSAVAASAEASGVGAVLAIAGDSAVAPFAPETVAKPLAQTAPVASPAAPNASQAASRLRDFRVELPDTAPLPFRRDRVAGRCEICGPGCRQFAGILERPWTARMRRGERTGARQAG